MTLAEIRTKVDNWLADKWVNVIVPKEQAYFAKHGRYFGMNWSPVAEVTDGTDTAFVFNQPSRFFVAQDVDVTFPSIPFQLQIICHDGPTGKGFTGWAKVKLLNGDVYLRSQGYGEYGETNPWFKFIPPN
jgi:hypothetical protein